MKIALVALVIFMTAGVTLSASLLERFGVDKNYLLIGLGAFVVTGLLAFRSLALVIIILLMALSINLPEEFLEQYYLDRDVLIVAVILMVIFPLVYREFVGKK